MRTFTTGFKCKSSNKDLWDMLVAKKVELPTPELQRTQPTETLKGSSLLSTSEQVNQSFFTAAKTCAVKDFIPAVSMKYFLLGMISPTMDTSLLENRRFLDMKMTVYDMITKYLIGRVKSHVGGKPTEAKACISLLVSDNWEMLMPNKVKRAVESLHSGFTRSTADDKSTPLTATAARIGRLVLNNPMDRTSKELLLVGDLFIDAFYNTKVIHLHRLPGWDGAHMVSMGERWDDLQTGLIEELGLRGIAYEKPADTVSNMREWMDTNEIPSQVYRSVVKRQGKNFELDLDAPWVKALDKQQQTPLFVNIDVFNAISSNEHLFFNEDKDTLHGSELAGWKSKKIAHKYTMHKAAEVAKSDRFYSMMDADYRGRLYHIEGFFNYQGNDTARSLIQFKEGVEIDERGEFWLAIHVATVANETFPKGYDFLQWCEVDYNEHLEKEGLDTISVDKMTLNDRAEWTYQNMDMICVLGNERAFWLDDKDVFLAEKPCQFLAACIEWSNMIAAFANKEEFVSHIPVPVDGSNNGWQHLAAMSRDAQAGELVGLTDRLIPNDFYLTTAKHLVSHMDDERLGDLLSKMSTKDIRKGISKRGSMIKAYSAGKGAIAMNMWNDVKQSSFHKKYGINEDDCKGLAKRLDESILEVCPGPLTTMKWFQTMIGHALGTYKFVNEEGEDKTKERTALRARKKELNYPFLLDENGENLLDEDNRYVKRTLTGDELQELNDISITLSSLTPVLKKGEGQTSITWKSPSGFVVHVDKFNSFQAQLFGKILNYPPADPGKKCANGVSHTIRIDTDVPDARGHASSVSPNIVHSYDAAHLCLTCYNFEGSFLGIHDSFATHASKVDELLLSTKNTFINMYETIDVFEELKHQILHDPASFTLDPPSKGKLKLSGIVSSDHFFG